MPRSRRALLVVTALSCGGVKALGPLYRLLDSAGVRIGRLLGRSYARRMILRGTGASRESVVAAVGSLAADPGIESVDLFLNVHGLERSLTFADGEVAVGELADALRTAGAGGRKLRLLYSTACHAAHHASAMREAGFRACLGARAINTSGALETPLFLALWARGIPAGRAIRIADHPAARLPADALARVVLRAVGERGRVDSRKVVSGEGDVTID